MSSADASCDLCGGKGLEARYRAPSGQRGIEVFVCRDCGLVQSLPRRAHVSHRPIAVSSGADWGNVRYGKGFRAEAALDTIARHIDLSTAGRCLDVGANRGVFVERLRQRVPGASVLAVEPDTRVRAAQAACPGVEWMDARIEDVPLPQGAFDLVHCSHTLEHVASAAGVLRQLRDALSPDGLLYLEVPNIAFIGRDDVVEEWFIDKHLYHFSLRTLKNMAASAGLRPIENGEHLDDENLVLLLQRAEAADPVRDEEAYTEAEALMAAYHETLSRNRKRLGAAARRIESLARTERLVFWGAGRIFDALVVQGGLDLSAIAGLVDKYLPDYVDCMHGLPLRRPEEIASLAPDRVIIASREYLEEIRGELARELPECPSVGFGELLEDGGSAAAGVQRGIAG